MKTLILMRHAHAAQGDDDFARPLTERGQKQAEVVGVDFKELGLQPDQVLCSSALRARRTAEIVAAVLGFSGEIVRSDELYEASMMDYFKAVQGIAEAAETLLLVGHNPSVSELLTAVHQREVELPPAGYEILRRPQWAAFRP
ncbi:MAG TPA: histidine phosphatase family protein [Polyangiaceae bacterium]|nr:histidine phosphatase family protein [Polyangiaceae bacterium]